MGGARAGKEREGEELTGGEREREREREMGRGWGWERGWAGVGSRTPAGRAPRSLPETRNAAPRLSIAEHYPSKGVLSSTQPKGTLRIQRRCSRAAREQRKSPRICKKINHQSSTSAKVQFTKSARGILFFLEQMVFTISSDKFCFYRAKLMLCIVTNHCDENSRIVQPDRHATRSSSKSSSSVHAAATCCCRRLGHYRDHSPDAKVLHSVDF